MTDLTEIGTLISNGSLTTGHRAAAVRSCTNNITSSTTYGQLLGHAIALANY